MAGKYTDWKTEANGYLVKGMAMSVVLVMFLLLVMPRFEASAKEEEVSDEAQVSEHFEFEEVVEEEEIIEEEAPEEEEEIINPEKNIQMNFDELGLEDIESAVERKTISTTDDLEKLNISFSSVDEASINQPYVVHQEMPTVIRSVKPIYPDIAIQNNVEGTLIVEAWVKVDGTVGNVRVIKSLQSIPGGLDEAAVNAVWQWTFEFAKSGGRPVACWVKIPLNLKFEDN
jgi:protein TonB